MIEAMPKTARLTLFWSFVQQRRTALQARFSARPELFTSLQPLFQTFGLDREAPQRVMAKTAFSVIYGYRYRSGAVSHENDDDELFEEEFCFRCSNTSRTTTRNS